MCFRVRLILHRWFAMLFRFFFVVHVILLAGIAPCPAQIQPDEQPGLVKLHNGLLLSGHCSLTNTTDPLLQNQKLELRKIDQGFREYPLRDYYPFRDYLVSTRQSAKVIPDLLAVPKHQFSISQRRTGQRAMNFEIGLHQQRPFGPDGKSGVTLTLQGGQKVDIETGIISINSQFAVVKGLSHKWMFGVSMETLSDSVLYSGINKPGLMTLVKDFPKGETQLNVVQTLLDAQKYKAARMLLNDVQAQFPELAPRCERSIERWNDQVGNQVVAELGRLRDTGQHEAARKYARRWPDENLDPVIRVRAKQFLEGLEEDTRRVETIKQALAGAVGDITDPQVRQTAGQVWREMRRELDLNSLSRFAPFELLGLGTDVAPESQLALAATGWLLGAENATDGFPEAAGLLQIRYLVLDYLQTTEDETALRNELLGKIRKQEGFSPERVAAIVQNLPPDDPISIDSLVAQGSDFELSAMETSPRITGRLPAEYNTTRKYPLLVAFPQAGVTSEKVRDWWKPHTDKNGYVLVVPELYGPNEVNYGASAVQHNHLLNSMRRLKSVLAIDDDRVFLVGHGIGGEAALDIGSAHPDLFAGITSIAGLGRRHLQWTAHNSTELPWYIVVGTRQPSYYRRMELLLRKLLQRVAIRGRLQFCNVLIARYAERGFEPYAEEVSNIFRWMNLQKRAEAPDRIEAVTVRSTDHSWHWLELNEIPERFCSLDAAHTFNTRPSTPGGVSASINNNLIRISQLPSNGALRLFPDIPDVDLSQPISLHLGGKTIRINYEPSTRDILEDFRKRRDRQRLCFMRVLLRK